VALPEDDDWRWVGSDSDVNRFIRKSQQRLGAKRSALCTLRFQGEEFFRICHFKAVNTLVPEFVHVQAASSLNQGFAFVTQATHVFTLLETVYGWKMATVCHGTIQVERFIIGSNGFGFG
jgi:hypothetical protein